MKIPESVRVVGKTYAVFVGRKDFELALAGRWGETDNAKMTIDLRGDLVADHLQETFLHELLHVVENCVIPNKVAEEIVYGMSAGLFAIFRDNGWWPE